MADSLFLFICTFVFLCEALPIQAQEIRSQENSPQIERELLFSRSADRSKAANLTRLHQFRMNELKARLDKHRRKSSAEKLASSNSSPMRSNEQDSLALVALYQSTEGSSWTDKSNWLQGPVSSWFGISVNQEGRVTEVDLQGNGLFGSLSEDIGQLSALENLDLSDNFLFGIVPESIGDLSSMNRLSLWGNGLSGSIPNTIVNLIQLEDVLLFANQFDGPIPDAFGSLPVLNRLYLDQNQFTGEIPVTLAGASNLTELFLDFNQLTGEIPPQLSTLSSMKSLALGNNQLEGEIPEELGDLQQLNVLDLSFAGLSGRIPEALSFMPSLTALLLSGNELIGEIPSGLGRLFNLTRLHLAGNQLTGVLPTSLGQDWLNLTELDLSNNLLEGSIPESIGILGILRYLDLSNNNFSGELPPFLLNNALRQIYLNDNLFIGDISGTFANSELLEEIDLSNNQFSGSLPSTLFGKQILKRLILKENSFSGELSISINRQTQLLTLDLWNNQFSGPLPAELGELTSLQFADLGSNHFSGEIPEEVGAVASMALLLLDENDLKGTVPKSIQNLQNLIGLSLKNNALDQLPDLTSLVALDSVDVSGNRFTFEDIEPNVDAAGGSINYAPQAPVPTIVDRLENGMRYQVRTGGQADVFEWLRNETVIDGADASELMLSSADSATMDSVYSQITNRIATELTLESIPVRTDAVLDQVEISPADTTLASGDSLQFAYQGFDQFGNIRYFSGNWTAGGGEISEDGWYVAGDTTGTFDVHIQNIDGSVFDVAEVMVEGAVEPVHVERDVPSTSSFSLLGNYPNPFVEETFIEFEASHTSPLVLTVYDALGRELIQRNERAIPTGRHTIRIETSNWAPGIYFYRIEAGDFKETQAIVRGVR